MSLLVRDRGDIVSESRIGDAWVALCSDLKWDRQGRHDLDSGIGIAFGRRFT